MKHIKNGLLYDTEAADLVADRIVEQSCGGSLPPDRVKIYRTYKGRYFIISQPLPSRFQKRLGWSSKPICFVCENGPGAINDIAVAMKIDVEEAMNLSGVVVAPA